jgi:hypothetical protein
MRVLVTGGRYYADRDLVYKTLDNSNVTLLIHGDCNSDEDFPEGNNARGADRLAKEWAIDRQVPYLSHPAEWKKHGRSAGPKRNQAMADRWHPQKVIAFPGGDGTAGMIRIARRLGIPVQELMECQP